jgi:hypothetical protein
VTRDKLKKAAGTQEGGWHKPKKVELKKVAGTDQA